MRKFSVYWTAFLFLGTGAAGGVLTLLAKYAEPGARRGLWLISDPDRYEIWKNVSGFPVPETPAAYGGTYAVLFALGIAILAARALEAFMDSRKTNL